MKIFKIVLALALFGTFASADKPKVDKKMPAFMTIDDFKLKTIDGKSINMLSKKKGYLFDNGKNKVTIMVIWSKDSKDSKKWLNQMQRLQETNPKKIQIEALEVDNMSNTKMKEFKKENNITYPMFSAAENKSFASQAIFKFRFLEKDKKTGKRGGVPFTVMFDYNGKAIYRSRGLVKQKEFEQYTKKVIEALDKKRKK